MLSYHTQQNRAAFWKCSLLWELCETYKVGCGSSPLNRHDGLLLCLFWSLRIALTSHGKVNQCPLRERIGRKGLKLRSVWGMLIYLETKSGDVVIKDSISQRSMWFNRTLPLTDGVFLTSALLHFACHKHYSRTRHLPEMKHPSQSWALMKDSF